MHSMNGWRHVCTMCVQPTAVSMAYLLRSLITHCTDRIPSTIGLFIKLGQSIGIQATILPKPYREAFSTIFDAAPQITYDEVEKVFRSEFGGKLPLEIFESFDKKPIASASIAQVHRARLRLPSIDGKPGEIREVAVKVQKPAIKKQLALDLWSYQSVFLVGRITPVMVNLNGIFFCNSALLWIYEKAFQIPCYFIAPYVAQQIKQETDFLNEADNSERTARFIADEPSLRDKIHVPYVFGEISHIRKCLSLIRCCTVLYTGTLRHHGS